MADMRHTAGAADGGESAGTIKAALVDEQSDHLGIAVGAARSHEQILALARVAPFLPVMLEAVGPGQPRRIDRRVARQRFIPGKRGDAILPASVVMRFD